MEKDHITKKSIVTWSFPKYHFFKDVSNYCMNLIFKVQALQACGKKQLPHPTCFPFPVHSRRPNSFHSFQQILYLVLLVDFTWKSSNWNVCPPSSVFSVLPASLPPRGKSAETRLGLSPRGSAAGPEKDQSYPSSKVWISPQGICYLLLIKEIFSLFNTN